MKRGNVLICTLIILTSINAGAINVTDGQLKFMTPQNELTAKRERNAKFYDRGHGLKTVVLSGSSSHYQDESGRWLEINTKIVGNTKGAWNCQSVNNTIKAYWNADQMAVADGDERIRLEFKGYGVNNGKELVKTARDKNATPSVKHNRLVYKDVFTSASEFYQVAPEQAYWESEGRMYKRSNS